MHIWTWQSVKQNHVIAPSTIPVLVQLDPSVKRGVMDQRHPDVPTHIARSCQTDRWEWFAVEHSVWSPAHLAFLLTRTTLKAAVRGNTDRKALFQTKEVLFGSHNGKYVFDSDNSYVWRIPLFLHNCFVCRARYVCANVKCLKCARKKVPDRRLCNAATCSCSPVSSCSPVGLLVSEIDLKDRQKRGALSGCCPDWAGADDKSMFSAHQDKQNSGKPQLSHAVSSCVHWSSYYERALRYCSIFLGM